MQGLIASSSLDIKAFDKMKQETFWTLLPPSPQNSLMNLKVHKFSNI